jgi:hypothetical protein
MTSVDARSRRRGSLNNIWTAPRRRAGPRFVVVAGGLALVAVLVLGRPVYRFMRGFSDPGSLPDRIVACDREWSLSEGSFWTADKAAVADGTVYDVVPGPFGLFTRCRLTPSGTVPTVLFVRTDENSYAVYALNGGP